MIRMFPTHIPVSERRDVQVGRNLLNPNRPIQTTRRAGIGPFSGEFGTRWSEGGLFVGLTAGEEGEEAGRVGVAWGGRGATGVGYYLVDGWGGCREGSVRGG